MLLFWKEASFKHFFSKLITGKPTPLTERGVEPTFIAISNKITSQEKEH